MIFFQKKTACEFTLLGSILDPGDLVELDSPSDVFTVGNYAFVSASGSWALTSVDVSNPATPAVEDSLFDTDLRSVFSVFVDGTYAYCTAFEPGGGHLTIVDVSDPANLSKTGSLTDADFDSAVHAAKYGTDHVVVVAQDSNSLFVVDVSTPATPSKVGTVTDATQLLTAGRVVVQGDYAYVACRFATRMTVVDISTVTAPFVAASLNDATELFFVASVAVNGNYAYCGCDDRLTVVDITTPTSPSVVTSLVDSRISFPQDIVWHNNHIFGTSQVDDSIFAVNVSTPGSPKFVAEYTTDLINPNGLHAVGDTLYVADEDSNGLRIFDISCF
jgi:hypothetical protein